MLGAPLVGKLQHAGQQFAQTILGEKLAFDGIQDRVVELLAASAGTSAVSAAVHPVVADIIGILPALAGADRKAVGTTRRHAAGGDPGEKRGAGCHMRGGLAWITAGAGRRDAVELIALDDDRGGGRSDR